MTTCTAADCLTPFFLVPDVPILSADLQVAIMDPQRADPVIATPLEEVARERGNPQEWQAGGLRSMQGSTIKDLHGKALTFLTVHAPAADAWVPMPASPSGWLSARLGCLQGCLLLMTAQVAMGTKHLQDHMVKSGMHSSKAPAYSELDEQLALSPGSTGCFVFILVLNESRM